MLAEMSIEMASVDMRLEPGARDALAQDRRGIPCPRLTVTVCQEQGSDPNLTNHTQGTTQVSSVDADGKNYLANVGPGDLWYFPAGIPHALQATNDDPDGTEFILIAYSQVFDSGVFSEDSTLLLTDWLAHVPEEILAKNFHVETDALKNIPAEELYIFPAEPPTSAQAPKSPQGTVPEPFSFQFSKVKPTMFSGGSVKVVDSSTFAISKTIAAAEVTVEPGAMRSV
ncbi:hypothetical protein Ac2012v2_002784 [Leucoagaricus gongylophorus]